MTMKNTDDKPISGEDFDMMGQQLEYILKLDIGMRGKGLDTSEPGVREAIYNAFSSGFNYASGQTQVKKDREAIVLDSMQRAIRGYNDGGIIGALRDLQRKVNIRAGRKVR